MTNDEIFDRCNGCRTCAEYQRDPPCLRCRALAAVVRYETAGQVAREEKRRDGTARTATGVRRRANEIRAAARVEFALIVGEAQIQAFKKRNNTKPGAEPEKDAKS